MKLQLLSDCKIRYLFLSDKIFCVYYFAMLKDAKSTTANGGGKMLYFKYLQQNIPSKPKQIFSKV